MITQPIILICEIRLRSFDIIQLKDLYYDIDVRGNYIRLTLLTTDICATTRDNLQVTNHISIPIHGGVIKRNTDGLRTSRRVDFFHSSTIIAVK